MKNKLTLDWLYAALIRAIKTMAQTALGMFTVGAALNEVQWGHVVSVAVVAGVYSLLTSLGTSLPEVATNGTMRIDTTDPAKDVYRLELDDDVADLKNKHKVTFLVDKNANLSRE